jgi:glycerol-3-phosphate dehydrogenase
MPIVEAVASLVRGEMGPQEMLSRLIARAAKPERA